MPQPAAAGSMQRRCCRCAQQPRARRRRAPGAPSAAAQLLLLGLLAALPAARAYAPHVSYSSRQKLAEHASKLPVKTDFLSTLPDADKRGWGTDLKLTVGETLRALGEAQAIVSVDVKLVGFDGSGNEGLRIEDHELQAQLRTLHSAVETVSLWPEPRRMGVQPTIDFRVHPANSHLTQQVNSAVAAAVASTPASTTWTGFGMSLISPQAVAHALDEDYAAGMRHGGGGYTLYILNPRFPGPYAYAYDNDHRSCPGGVHISRDHRYAFYDLSANITFYGPGPGGRGQVLSHSVPALAHYRSEALRRAILPDLAALVFSGSQHLVWPPLAHAEVTYHESIAVHIIYMHQDLMGAVSHIDKGSLETELRDAVGGIQKVQVYEHWHPFGNCPQCVAGYSSALRTRTTLPHETVEMTQYLDVESLETWVHEWREVVLSDVGAAALQGRTEGVHVLPVFVFDAAGADTILLDGWRQAVALPGGEVVAVRSGRQTVPTFFGCHDKQVHIDPQELQRPVLAAILSAGWGVADTALFWSEATGRSWNWLWSLGPTPFGPLSTQAALSFVQRDAMVRNVAVATINASAAHVATLLHGFAAIGGDSAHVKDFLAPEQVIPYHQRMSLLLAKLHEAMGAISRLDFQVALGYAGSLSYDAAALHTIVRRTRNGMDVKFECLGKEERARWWALPAGAAAVCVLLVLWRLLHPRQKREKRHSY